MGQGVFEYNYTANIQHQDSHIHMHNWVDSHHSKMKQCCYKSLRFHLMHPSYEHFGTFQSHGHSGHIIPSGIISTKVEIGYVFVLGIGSATTSGRFPIDIQSTFVELTDPETGPHVHFDGCVSCGGSTILVGGHILLDLANLLRGWCKPLGKSRGWLNLSSLSLFRLFLSLLCLLLWCCGSVLLPAKFGFLHVLS